MPGGGGPSARYLPDPYPEFGQCVHKVARDAVNRQQLYLQNHLGVYRSDDGAASWISIADGLPSDFGFAMVAHPHRGQAADGSGSHGATSKLMHRSKQPLLFDHLVGAGE